MGIVQDMNKAVLAHEHIFSLDFYVVIEKEISSVDKCLETKHYVDFSFLKDPQKKWINQRNWGSVFWSTVA